MVQNKDQQGHCHICGAFGKLTFEHVPPRSAFNNSRVTRSTFEEALASLHDRVSGIPPDPSRGRYQQRGSGAFTLCGSCNSKTGDWYAGHFAEWCVQAMDILARTNGRPILIYLNYLRPLPILKQIITMFFSANSERFAQGHPDLVRFVLNRDSRFLPRRFRIYVYYTLGDSRSAGVTGMINLTTGYTRLVSEISAPPIGYVMTIDEDAPPDPRLIEITHFVRYEYYDVIQSEVKMSVLPVASPFPADYRTHEEIVQQSRDSMRRSRK